MVLQINTEDAELIKVELVNEGKKINSKEDKNKFGSQALLPLIQSLFKENNVRLSDLTGVQVCVGPGSYTGIKVGVSVANAFAFSLNIPVNNKVLETELKYT